METKGKIYENCVEVVEQYDQTKSESNVFLSDVFSGKNKKEKILLVGEVQSGKTRAIIEIIKEAIRRNFSYAIVFGGTTNLLNKQTLKRLSNDIKKTYNDITIEFLYPDSLENINFHVINRSKPNVFFVFCFLKGKVALEKITNDFLQIYPQENKNVLIIDDESDFASVRSNKKHDTAMHSIITNIYLNTQLCKFVMVTATPFANILTSPLDPLYPEKIILLEPHLGYTGSDFFLKHDVYYEIEATRTNEETWEKAVYESLHHYLIATAIRNISFAPEILKSEFLINVDSKKPQHAQAKAYVCRALKKIWENPDYFNPTFEKIYKEQFANKNIPVDDILNQIQMIVKGLLDTCDESIVVLNEGNTYKSGKFVNAIIIGGILISRGFTFEHLITELILNASDEENSVDTLLQRARWFGYRKTNDQYKFMRVYMNKKIKSSLKESDDALNFFRDNYRHPSIRKMLIDFEKKNLKTTRLTGKPKIG